MSEHECAPGCGCGGNLSSYATSAKCPKCGGKLRLLGRLQQAEFRLECSACGYQSHLLSQQEIGELL